MHAFQQQMMNKDQGQENKEYLVPHSFEFSADQQSEFQETDETGQNFRDCIGNQSSPWKARYDHKKRQ